MQPLSMDAVNKISAQTENKPLLLGCGIFKKEIHWLSQHNGWDIDTHFLPPSLHINFNKLSTTLTKALKEDANREKAVFYGACHPQMDKILEDANTFRTCGVNCVDMLLGHELYMQELEDGAFFLLEDWAVNWNKVITETFGDNKEITQEIFQGDRKYIMAIRTPVSDNFSKEAKEAAEYVGLPLRFMDVSLDRLQSVLEKVIHKIEEE